jgi:hypothetical protein
MLGTLLSLEIISVMIYINQITIALYLLYIITCENDHILYHLNCNISNDIIFIKPYLHYRLNS